MAKVIHFNSLDLLFFEYPYNVIRRSKVILFDSLLSEHEIYKALTQEKKTLLLKEMELSCYLYIIDKAYENNIMASWDNEMFSDMYHSICYKISSNIEKGGIVDNESFAISLIEGNIDPSKIPSMTSIEMFPQKYQITMQRIEASKTIVKNVKTSALYHCHRCKQNKCSMENLYNRSMDEGVNLKITCLNCFTQWNA
jgi:hypothetical protein